MDEFCKEKGFVGWFETSAKENINIDESARFLVTRVSYRWFKSIIKFCSRGCHGNKNMESTCVCL